MGERRGRKALEIWCRRVVEGYPGVEIINMTTSWRDGLAFCAMIHRFRPDLIDFEKLDKKDVFKNNDLAFSIADSQLGIPALLDADDMVAYDVPDRLSILTYLSQFYQVFGAPASPARQSLKRQEVSPDMSSISSLAKPPAAKMAHVPRREPCKSCGNPVFLAERLTIDKYLFHRTCLKCARCNTQLSLGSFYETEKDGEFCCETCPDEEKKLAQIENTTTNTDRKTFSEKLALFQGNEKGLLQKSLSDEEKSKSLKRMNEEYLSSSSSDKKSVSNFMFDETDQPPPALPTTKPPSEIITHNSESPQKTTPSTPVNIEAKNNLVISSLSKDKEPLEALTVSTKNVTKEEKVIQNISLEPQLLHQFKSQTEIQFCDDASASNLTVDLNYTPEESSTDHSLEYFKKDIIEEETIIEKVPEEKINQEIVEDVINEESESASYRKEEEIDKQIDKQPEPDLIRDVKKNEIEVRINEAIASVEEEVVIVIETEDKKDEKKIEEIGEWKIEVTEDVVEPQKEEEIEEVEKPEEMIEEVKIEVETILVQPSSSSVTNPTPLNPFGEDEDEEEETEVSKSELETSRKSMNPFGSDDDEEEEEPIKPKPRVSTNPFGSDTDDDDDDTSASTSFRAPVPLPRMTVQSSPRSFTPEPSPRHQHYKVKEQLRSPETNFIRNGSFRGSAHSLASSSGSGYSTVRHKKGKAPAPPISSIYGSINELYPPRSSMDNTPSHSQNVSPKSTPKSKKKRPAPPPPTSTPKQSYDESSSDLTDSLKNSIKENSEPFKRKLIPLDSSLLDLSTSTTQRESDDVVYRRTIMPLSPETTFTDDSLISEESKSDRQWEKMKDNKESQNAKRQSQVSLTNNEIDSIYSSKAAHGQWKRRKGPAPGLPVPPKKVIQIPLQEIRHELEIIEVQQQGLEKQGVMLEKMIRDRCEGPDQPDEVVENVTNSKDVEDLIMQLFDLVNEKNDLFRRQAELMYLRRQHRLEQEQIDIEYEIRTLMAQPEQNKTDTDKEREESLIARLLEVVELRNEVVDCLEMDRLREHEEDLSIKQQIEIHTAKRDEEINQQTPTKLSKKEKKKQKEIKKLTKNKKMDADKDDDESELNAITKEKEKKKKKKFLF